MKFLCILDNCDYAFFIFGIKSAKDAYLKFAFHNSSYESQIFQEVLQGSLF